MNLKNILQLNSQGFKQNIFLKNVLIITTGTALGQVVAMLSTPVITRMYSPEDFGVFTTFSAILVVIGSISNLRYSVAIPIAESDKLANNVLKISFIITIVLGLFLGLVIVFFGKSLTKMFSVISILPYLWILPLSFVAIGFYDALSNWAIRGKYFGTITKTRISQGITSSGIKITLGFFGFQSIGLLIGIVVQHSSGFIALFTKLIKEEPLFLFNTNWKEMVFTAKRFINFPLYQTGSQLLLTLGLQLPVLFIGLHFGIHAVGYYGLAYSVVNLPMNLVGASVSQVYFSEIAEFGIKRPDKLLKMSKSIVKKMFLIGLIPIMIIVCFGPYLFNFFFGDLWREAGNIARLLSLIVLIEFFTNPIAHSLNVLEKQKLQLKLSFIRLTLILIIFNICGFFELSLNLSLLIYSVSISAYYLITLYIIFNLLKLKTNLLVSRLTKK